MLQLLLAAGAQTPAAVTATGTVRLKTGAEVRVGAQISGLVSRLDVEVGSKVARGQVIAVIDSRGFPERVEQARAQIRVDRLTIEKQEKQLARLRPLAQESLVSRGEVEDVEADLALARARFSKSLADLRVVESDRPYLTIRAPIDGIIASISTQQGETVAASFSAPTFVTVIDTRALELVAMIDETDIGLVQPGDAVAFTTETHPDHELHGEVQRVAPKATVVSGVVNYEVTIAIRDGIDELKPDMTANVTIRGERRLSGRTPQPRARQ
jgi:RND family efflux transporter MFP subunit